MPARKPRNDELDFHGLTHQGRVRGDNQDHFLIGSLQRRVEVHATSLSDLGAVAALDPRAAFIAMVADGVGGGSMGEEASRLAVEQVTNYVAESVRCYYAAGPDEADLSEALTGAALSTHEALVSQGGTDPDRRGMATTLTLWLGVWPDSYLLQVGDSRCYILRDGVLGQMSRDQTMAQELIDQGILTAANAGRTRWANTLSSSIGGSQSAPVVTRIEQRWGDVGLLCSDGLTRHVSDDRITQRLSTMTSARQACEALLQDALDGGGTDNITILIGRAIAAETSR
jgi:protein phosphatase